MLAGWKTGWNWCESQQATLKYSETLLTGLKSCPIIIAGSSLRISAKARRTQKCRPTCSDTQPCAGLIFTASLDPILNTKRSTKSRCDRSNFRTMYGSDRRRGVGFGWLLSLQREWFDCRARYLRNRPLWIAERRNRFAEINRLMNWNVEAIALGDDELCIEAAFAGGQTIENVL
jgi:hypothetical protein